VLVQKIGVRAYKQYLSASQQSFANKFSLSWGKPNRCCVGDILRERDTFQFNDDSTFMSTLVMDKAWHSNGI
jgi:hypothetical protein